MVAERVAAHLDYARLADAIVARQTPAELVPATEIAKRIGYSPTWVRRHKAELGGVPMTENGSKPRIGFDPAHVDRVMASRRHYGG